MLEKMSGHDRYQNLSPRLHIRMHTNSTGNGCSSKSMFELKKTTNKHTKCLKLKEPVPSSTFHQTDRMLKLIKNHKEKPIIKKLNI